MTTPITESVNTAQHHSSSHHRIKKYERNWLTQYFFCDTLLFGNLVYGASASCLKTVAGHAAGGVY